MPRKPKIIEDEPKLVASITAPASEAIQKLQSNIAFAGVGGSMHVIGVTSSVQGEGKSTMICNMAYVYALRGAKVCLVNLDLRRPSIHRFFQVKNTAGVEEYVSGEASLEDVIVHLPNGVDLINAGTRTPFPTKILSSDKMGEFFKELKAKDYDYILVDTTPSLMLPDAALVAPYIDGYLFVCAQHVSKKKEAKATISSLQRNGINIIGVVMTNVTDYRDVDEGYHSHYYYYDKYYKYDDKEEEEKPEEKPEAK
ncbi:MAG: CpsD/CapB family tyrosine-protein kinase [Bacilli bacterium]|nr:CpsD/CapB family tyrosine-protein kinase [Bacilli bacterium]